MNKKQTREAENQETLEKLRELLPVGSTVYTSLVKVSRSGMNRKIKVFAMKDCQPLNISWSVCQLGIGTLKDIMGSRAVSVNGCGMDMGYHIVTCLSDTLYSEGFDCIGENCPSNDHSNSYYMIGKCVNCGNPLTNHEKTIGAFPLLHKYNHELVCGKHAEGPWHHKSSSYAFNHVWL
jgi:hypothetical protein